MLPCLSFVSPQPSLEPESGVKETSREVQRKEDNNDNNNNDLVTNRYIRSKGDITRCADQAVICCML